MAMETPTIVPPRTPPPEEALEDDFNDEKSAFNPDALSPMAQNFPGSARKMSSFGGRMSPPKGQFSPVSPMPPYSPLTGTSGSESFPDSDNIKSPFNFQTVQYAPGRGTAGKSVS